MEKKGEGCHIQEYDIRHIWGGRCLKVFAKALDNVFG
jgi:hypothetical protein